MNQTWLDFLERSLEMNENDTKWPTCCLNTLGKKELLKLRSQNFVLSGTSEKMCGSIKAGNSVMMWEKSSNKKAREQWITVWGS